MSIAEKVQTSSLESRMEMTLKKIATVLLPIVYYISNAWNGEMVREQVAAEQGKPQEIQPKTIFEPVKLSNPSYKAQ